MNHTRRFSSFYAAGRPSNAHNEDDYDYAIELRPDDEYRYLLLIYFVCFWFSFMIAINNILWYRQVAEALPDIIDFEDLEEYSDDMQTPAFRNAYVRDSISNGNYFDNSSGDASRRHSTKFDEQMMTAHSLDHSVQNCRPFASEKQGSEDVRTLSQEPPATSTDDEHIGESPNKHGRRDSGFGRILNYVSKTEFCQTLNLLNDRRNRTENAARR
jgi:hypothetical protein